jgi:hypothetical protein
MQQSVPQGKSYNLFEVNCTAKGLLVLCTVDALH